MARGLTSGKAPEKVYVARSSGVIQIKDQVYRYIANRTRVHPGHPILGVIPERFREIPADVDVIDARPTEARAPRLVREAPLETLAASVPDVEVETDGTLSDPIEGDPEGEPSAEVEEA